MSVRKVVETIESIEDHKQEEAKKKENEKKESRKKVTMKKEEEEVSKKYLSLTTRIAYLQGLGPETRQGQTPTSSNLESGDSPRVSESSSAGPSMMVESNRGQRMLE